MKKIIIPVLVLAWLLSGCTPWTGGQYYSEQLHIDESGVHNNPELEASTYGELLNVLSSLVAKGTENAVIYCSEIDRNAVDGYMERAISHVIGSTPLGAYAVNTIRFDSGTNTGRQAIAVTVEYNHGRSEILQIRHATDMDAACQWIEKALQNCDASITVMVDSYEGIDIVQYVQDYVDRNPDICMEMPQVSAAVYPEEGKSRVLEVLFSYQTSREDLRQMQQTVAPVFDSAELYVSGDADIWEKYFQLYSFLMERHRYSLETSITPTYHLLRHGVGDSKAFATVYALMCRRAGLPCEVVSGTRGGESRYWNVIDYEGEFYYVDLLACDERGAFNTGKREDMIGYVWDYDLYQSDISQE